MQVAFTPTTPAEARLLASFFQDYADLLEQQLSQLPLPNVAPVPDLQAALEKPAAAKRTRKPSAATAEAPAASGSPESAPAATTEAGNESPAPDATEPEKSSEEQAGNSEEKKDSPAASPAEEKVVTVDELRQFFGQLSQAGKRDAAVKIVRKHGANGISEIAEDKRNAVMAEFKEL